MLRAIVPARRTALVVALPANQTKPRPPYRHDSQQQKWHRPAPLNASPSYNVPPQLTRKCFPSVANHSTPAPQIYFCRAFDPSLFREFHRIHPESFGEGYEHSRNCGEIATGLG
jgi:hypothetical protein